MLSRFPRAVYASSLFRAPRISRTSLLAASFGSKASSRPRSSAERLHIAPPARRGVIPEHPDPIPNNVTDDSPQVAEATRLSDKGYRALVDLYFEAVLEYSSEAQEQGSNIAVEHHDDVITIIAPGVGPYVLKCQPSCKQIWLSSPISGSKAYDWVVHGQKQHPDDGVTFGQWLHLRDGTNLSAVLNTELGLEMEMLFA